MKAKPIYLALCFVGALLPYWQFVPRVVQHGMNLSLFVRELFASRDVGVRFPLPAPVGSFRFAILRSH